MNVPSPTDMPRQRATGPSETDPPADLLVWDAPNIDMTLANIIGRRPSRDTRPRYDQVARWFVADSAGSPVQAVVFTNYTEGTASNIRPWLEAVRGIGFDVFIKPKLHDDDDIDEDMIRHIQELQASRGLVRLVVVSGDGKAFQGLLVELAHAGVLVTVVSFAEVASWARQMPTLTFLDIEEIPGAFSTPLDRVRLEALPPEGAWLRATGDLRANREPTPMPVAS